MPDMIALKAFRYRGKLLQPDEPFEALTSGHARVHRALGNAHDAPAKAKAKPRAAKPQDDPSAASGEYLRRDMRAED
ncbi:hypothetical protein [Sphingomonas nostoxanthinifaciens]|uniref:hypothetical protein n=1 Tax=Sphingomonas nostoxanthinifaciens TaxID=2872652 RepID=UPI001CC217D5|nr:hypothetical protein [Sphingomonas nostoxanthinifaciens]UAK23663.1 hypothetical protein K8P63_14920 [Sphingomonas nostoxanthinifaciens]